jgi:hypothetical protein
MCALCIFFDSNNVLLSQLQSKINVKIIFLNKKMKNAFSFHFDLSVLLLHLTPEKRNHLPKCCVNGSKTKITYFSLKMISASIHSLILVVILILVCAG